MQFIPCHFVLVARQKGFQDVFGAFQLPIRYLLDKLIRIFFCELHNLLENVFECVDFVLPSFTFGIIAFAHVDDWLLNAVHRNLFKVLVEGKHCTKPHYTSSLTIESLSERSWLLWGSSLRPLWRSRDRWARWRPSLPACSRRSSTRSSWRHSPLAS